MASKTSLLTPAPNKTKSKRAARVWRVNWCALTIMGLLLVLVIGTLVGYYFFGGDKGKSILSQAKVLTATRKQDELAINYTRLYLKSYQPMDLNGHVLLADLLARNPPTPMRLLEAIRTGETILRLDPNPKGERAQTARKRLIEAYLAVGPMLPREEQKYHTAALVMQDLIANLPAPPDASILQLQGRVFERLGAQGDNAKKQEAAAVLEKARKLDPKDIEAAEHLAVVYFMLLENHAKADAVLVDLIKVNPSVPAYLRVAKLREAFARELADHGREPDANVENDLAAQALQAALKEAPNDLETCLAAAESALVKANPKEAQEYLDRVPEAKRDDVRYQTFQGVADLYENRALDAIEEWSRGLRLTSGSEADLSFKLAAVLLQLGRVSEAEPLIDQFRRLTGVRLTEVGTVADEITPPAALLDGAAAEADQQAGGGDGGIGKGAAEGLRGVAMAVLLPARHVRRVDARRRQSAGLLSGGDRGQSPHRRHAAGARAPFCRAGASTMPRRSCARV